MIVPRDLDRGGTVAVRLVNAADMARLLADRGYDPVYGARPLQRAIQRMVLDPLAMQIIEGKLTENSEVFVDANEEELVFQNRLVEAA